MKGRAKKRQATLSCIGILVLPQVKDPLILKTLLDFRADRESCGLDGMTALIHSARRDNASFAFLLLEDGAIVNATSVVGETPLSLQQSQCVTAPSG